MTCMLVAAPAATSSFTVTHEIAIDETATDKEEASLILSEDTGGKRRLVLLIRRSRLTLLLGSKRVWKKRIALSTGAHHILIKQRPSGVAVCLDMRELTRRSVQLSGGVSARFIPSAGIRAKTTPRVQRVGDILFGDNFAREGIEGEPQNIEVGDGNRARGQEAEFYRTVMTTPERSV